MRRFFINLLLLFFTALLFAEPSIPVALSEKYTRVCESDISDDGEWFFMSTEKLAGGSQNKINVIYALNTKTEEYFKIFENTGASGINSIHFFPKTKKLYFIVNNGRCIKNGIQTFEGFGVYTLQKDLQGNYSSNGLKRYAAPQNWIMKNLNKAYAFDTDTPDYKGFLDYLFGFADAGVTPIFRIKISGGGGGYAYNEDALRYLYKENQFENLLNETRDAGIFPLEKYLFACDKNGNPTDKTAYTNNGSKNFRFCEDKFVTRAYFVEADNRLYFFATVGSTKLINDKKIWSIDYSVIFEIYDENSGFYFHEPPGLEYIKAEPYEDNNTGLPIYEDKNRLIINDVDGKTKWIYTKFGLEKYDEAKEISTANNSIGQQSDNTVQSHDVLFKNPLEKVLFVICVFLLVCVGTIAIILSKFISGRITTKRQRTFTYKIQEDEKQKIAKDIHDTIVQDIRAIRIDAEMLSVTDDSKQKQSELVEKITQCIVKMRNICYGLSPAELSLQGGLQTGDVLSDKVDLLSILDTLCSQFTTQTKIPCHLNIDGEMSSALLPKEKCENLLRIIQEAFRNIEKHSYATEAQVLVREDSEDKKNFLNIFIIDDGRGCDLKEVLSRKSYRIHFGLRSMKERVEMIGGEVSFRSMPGDGMQIKLKINL